MSSRPPPRPPLTTEQKEARGWERVNNKQYRDEFHRAWDKLVPGWGYERYSVFDAKMSKVFGMWAWGEEDFGDMSFRDFMNNLDDIVGEVWSKSEWNRPRYTDPDYRSEGESSSEQQPPPPPPPPPRPPPPRQEPEGNYYEWLGVPRTATPAEIRKAFLQGSLRHHPDKGGDPAMFRRIREAYETLYDAQQRRMYDADNAPPPPSPAPAQKTAAEREAQERQRKKWREAAARRRAKARVEKEKKQAAERRAAEHNWARADELYDEWATVNDFEAALAQAYEEESRAAAARNSAFEQLSRRPIIPEPPDSVYKRRRDDEHMRNLFARRDDT